MVRISSLAVIIEANVYYIGTYNTGGLGGIPDPYAAPPQPYGMGYGVPNMSGFGVPTGFGQPQPGYGNAAW